jgi:IclR-like helix-turn-helix domain-containing protein
MRFWEKSVQIFNSLWEAGPQRVRPMAQHTGLSKSRAHRLTQAMVHRDTHPASWLWETAAGRRGLTRVVVAPL